MEIIAFITLMFASARETREDAKGGNMWFAVYGMSLFMTSHVPPAIPCETATRKNQGIQRMLNHS